MEILCAMDNIKILNVKVSSANQHEIHKQISRIIVKGGHGFILSGNIHGLNTARNNKWLADFYNQADIVRVDGVGVIVGARILGYRICKRMTWADWGWDLAEYLAQKGHSLYLLGGPMEIASQAAINLQSHAPGLKILHTHHGYFKKTGPENDDVIKQINFFKPDILVVGMGMPLQERWILDNYKNIHTKLFITAGAAFEYLAGTVKRCPKWMGEIGMEWVVRLIQDPHNKFKRYVWGNTIFILNTFRERLKLE